MNALSAWRAHFLSKYVGFTGKVRDKYHYREAKMITKCNLSLDFQRKVCYTLSGLQDRKPERRLGK